MNSLPVITVCNVPDYGDHTVAEHAFALLLALCRGIPEATERVRRGDVWVRVAGRTWRERPSA